MNNEPTAVLTFKVGECADPDCDKEFGTYDEKQIYCKECAVKHSFFGSDEDIEIGSVVSERVDRRKTVLNGQHSKLCFKEGFVDLGRAMKMTGLSRSTLINSYYLPKFNVDEDGFYEVAKINEYLESANNRSDFKTAAERHNTGELNGYTLAEAMEILGFNRQKTRALCTCDKLRWNMDGTLHRQTLDDYVQHGHFWKTPPLFVCRECKKGFVYLDYVHKERICKKCKAEQKAAKYKEAKSVEESFILVGVNLPRSLVERSGRTLDRLDILDFETAVAVLDELVNIKSNSHHNKETNSNG